VISVGDRIGHIRIDAALGEGGMGEVYRGFDERLERPVAVKTILAEQRMSPESKARFLREARLLSKLDHPNICRVYDLIEGADSDHLVLEYIEGRTLREQMEGGMSASECLRISLEVLDALAAAHREHIVHRDLKPDNIMITSVGKAKVLDFGLARSVKPGTATSPPAEGPPPEAPAASDGEALTFSGDGLKTVIRGTPTDALPLTMSPLSASALRTADGIVVGTLRYMSPEQAEGGVITEASDMYSFGLMLQEMLTGRPPYEADTAAQLYQKVARGEAAPASGIDPEIARLIESFKRRDPASRPRAEEAAAHIRHVLERPARRRRRRLLAIGSAGIVLLLGLTALVTHRFATPAPLLTPGQRARLVLLPFSNATGNPADTWIQYGLMDMSLTALQDVKSIEVVPDETVRKAIESYGLPKEPDLRREQLLDLAKAVHANLIIRTTVTRSGKGFEFTYESVNANGSYGKRSFEAEELTAGAGMLGQRLIQRLDPAAPLTDVRDRYTEDPFINQVFAMGVQRQVTDGALVARPFFEFCANLDPGFTRTRYKLAHCETDLANWDRATELAESARARAAKAGDRKLESLCLALLASIANQRGEFDRVQSLLQPAIAIQQSLDDRESLSRSYQLAGLTAWKQRKYDEANKQINQALKIAYEIGDRYAVARFQRDLGGIAEQTEHDEDAEKYFRSALATQREIRDRLGQAMTLNSLGILTQARGDLAGAEKCYLESLAIKRQIGDRNGEASTLSNLGTLAYAKGDLTRAEDYLRQALAVNREIGNAQDAALNAYNLTELYITQKRFDDARSMLGIANEFYGRVPGSPDHIDTLMMGALLEYAQDRFAAAAETGRGARSLAGKNWSKMWTEFLRAFERAEAAGKRMPLPGEDETQP